MKRWGQAAFGRLLLTILALMLLLSACSGGDTPQITGHVQVLYGEEELIDAEISVDQDSMAHTAIMSACQEQKLAYVYTDGMFDGFGGYASTNTDGWLLYVDGELAEVGAGSVALREGFDLVFSYVNYEEAFDD